MAYATVSDYLAHTGTTVPPAGLDRLLTVASNRVDEILIGCIYDTDSQGRPTDTDVKGWLRDATCEQVLYMLDTGDSTGAGGFVQQTVGRISWSQGKGANGETQPRHAPEAIGILHVNGLLPTVPDR